jgi:hypothetical protein
MTSMITGVEKNESRRRVGCIRASVGPVVSRR